VGAWVANESKVSDGWSIDLGLTTTTTIIIIIIKIIIIIILKVIKHLYKNIHILIIYLPNAEILFKLSLPPSGSV
jgi:hypothetical protein